MAAHMITPKQIQTAWTPHAAVPEQLDEHAAVPEQLDEHAKVLTKNVRGISRYPRHDVDQQGETGSRSQARFVRKTLYELCLLLSYGVYRS